MLCFFVGCGVVVGCWCCSALFRVYSSSSLFYVDLGVFSCSLLMFVVVCCCLLLVDRCVSLFVCVLFVGCLLCGVVDGCLLFLFL